MKKILLFLAINLFALSALMAQVEIVKPALQSNHKAFAIIIDQHTYAQTKDAVMAYKQAVEADGLPTYIVAADFTTPDQVKTEIEKLYASPQSLEGVVFIGEIPIVKIRNAQHMTTAFKMNEETFPFEQSSVPSDRFYDDFHLTFDYLKQDETNSLVHYYKLREDSPQELSPSIYSARIRYPKGRGGDPYQAISEYLYKVARTKRDNLLDHFVAYTGVAYNSECMVAWRDDVKAYREDFPFLGQSNKHFRQLNFRMDPFMKYPLFDEMQREEVDLMLIRKHGTPTKELIGYAPENKGLADLLESTRRDLYNRLRRAKSNGQNVDSLKNVYMTSYMLNADFFAKLEDESTRLQDSTIQADEYISTDDLKNLRTNPLYVILDACYNGSFDEDDYIAGSYIFNEGNTIAAQGNTRNVLQDKWTMDLTGLLSYGVRLGWVHNQNPTLEGHLIGDPTFHFARPSGMDLNHALSSEAGNGALWKDLLAKDNPVYQSLALAQLAASGQVSSDVVGEYFANSPYHTVRMQALNVLSMYNDANFLNAVKAGLDDDYEMIARQSAIYAAKIGDDSLLPVMARVYVEDKSRMRVLYNLESRFQVFAKEKFKEAMIVALAQSDRVEKEKEIAELKESLAVQSYFERGFSDLMNAETDLEERLMQARSIRNYNYHDRVGSYLSLMEDKSQPEELRVILAEALGWFNHSVKRDEIVGRMKRMIEDSSLSVALRGELVQSLIRLQ